MRSKKGRVLLLWVLVCPGVTGAIVVPFSISSALGIAMGFIISFQLTQWCIFTKLHNDLQQECASFNRTGNTRNAIYIRGQKASKYEIYFYF